MSQRTIKNYTNQDIVLGDLGGVIIPANGANDIGGDEQRLVAIASSNDLLNAIARGIDKVQVNDGIKDLSFSEGIDTIRKVASPMQVDQQGRAIVRTDSKRVDYEVVFCGVGDDTNGTAIGTGQPLRWDFSDTNANFVDAPTGFKRIQLNWSFCDPTYTKSGSLYFYDAPKGAYLDFFHVFPMGLPFLPRYINPQSYDVEFGNYEFAPGQKVIGHWVSKHWVEGTCPMGDHLDTESAHSNAAPAFVQYRCEITVPEINGWELFHGHIILEIYRGRSIIF
jgi:hypothetical protein